MKTTGFLLLWLSCFFTGCVPTSSQNKADELSLSAAAGVFLQTLSEQQREKVFFPFDTAERFNWHFVPLAGKRKGIPVEELDSAQQKAAFDLLKFTLSEQGYRKAKGIMELEAILKELEGRAPEDDYRDPGKYYFSIFGQPSSEEPWGWRLEGHHLSINYTSADNKLVSATPEFMGANPAIVPNGPHKGMQLLKNETELGFQLLHSLTEEQLRSALLEEEAPADIITGNDRKAILEHPEGIRFDELNDQQKKLFMHLLNTYIGNFRKEFSDRLMKKLEGSGMDSLHFAWAGSQQPGKGHYYRIHGPVLLIEYDNTQNNANHVHTVVRDLTNDFGEDALKQHYEKGHSHSDSQPDSGAHQH